MSPTCNSLFLVTVVAVLSPWLSSRLLRGHPVPPGEARRTEKLTIDADTLPPGWVVEQIEVRSRRFHNAPMRSLHLPQDLLFVSVVRGDERIIPRGHTTLEQFDTVPVMGDPASLRRIRRLLEERDVEKRRRGRRAPVRPRAPAALRGRFSSRRTLFSVPAVQI